MPSSRVEFLPAAGRESNLPWVLHLPVSWRHPAEKEDIVTAYPHLADWAQSGGTLHKNWYLDANAIPEVLYTP